MSSNFIRSGIFALPDELTFQIFEYLRVQDLLNFRQTSRLSAECVDKYNTKFKRYLEDYKICFNSEEDFNTFATTVIFTPFSTFEFNFPFSFENKNVERFLGNYGDRVKSLQIDQLHAFMDEKERLFYEKLKFLETLSVNQLGSGLSFQENAASNDYAAFPSSSRGNVTTQYPMLPRMFENLKNLHIRQVEQKSALEYILRSCKAIVSLCCGKYKEKHTLNSPLESRFNLNDIILMYCKTRTSSQNYQQKSLFMDEDLLSKMDEQMLSSFFMSLYEANIHISKISSGFLRQTESKLENHSIKKYMMERVLEVDGIYLPTGIMKSLKSINIKINSYNLKLLKKESEIQLPGENFWPAVENIKFEIVLSNFEYFSYANNIAKIWTLFFGEWRKNLLKLDLGIKYPLGAMSSTQIQFSLDFENFPRLRELTLDVQQLSRTEFKDLIIRLGTSTHIKLLDLTLKCPVYSDCLIGDDPVNPSFLKLKDLRHFSIRSVQPTFAVPQFADLDEIHEDESQDFLREVLPHCKLNCLVIQSDCDASLKMSVETLRTIRNGILCNYLKFISWVCPRSYDSSSDWEEEYEKLRDLVKLNRHISYFQENNDCVKCKKL